MANQPDVPSSLNLLKTNGLFGFPWIGWVCTAVLAVSVLLPAGSVGATSLPSAPGIRIIDSDEVLSSHTEPLPPAGLVFREASGALVRFILSVEDPEIRNRGDGAFHPADEATVCRSLQEVSPEWLRPLRVEIYLLPYPRSGFLSSSADSRAIYVSPGVREYDADQVAFLITHEIGHIFHRRLMPDSVAALWAEWAALRGTADVLIFNDGAAHAYRPHEIFAEDFRVLFGGSTARGNGTIENPELALPDAVPGLRDFYERLLGATPSPAVARASVSPNPVRAGQVVVLRLPGGERMMSGGVNARLLDVTGRVVADVAFRPAGGVALSASLGNVGGPDGGPVGGLAAGAYWLRVTTRAGAPPEIVPIRILR